MTDHQFELTIRGTLDERILDSLFEAGCDDATFSSRGNLTFAAFDRQAPTPLDALVPAIRDVESISGLQVLRVDPDELVWSSEIAKRSGRSRQSIEQLVKGKRGPGGFPAPVTHATRNPLWRWSEVEAWFSTYDGREPDIERSMTIGAINGVLDARRCVRGVREPSALRAALDRLLTDDTTDQLDEHRHR